MEKSGAVLSLGEGLVLIARSESRKREAKMRVGDCPSLAAEFGAWSMQKCKEVLCFGRAGTVG